MLRRRFYYGKKSKQRRSASGKAHLCSAIEKSGKQRRTFSSIHQERVFRSFGLGYIGDFAHFRGDRRGIRQSRSALPRAPSFSCRDSDFRIFGRLCGAKESEGVPSRLRACLRWTCGSRFDVSLLYFKKHAFVKLCLLAIGSASRRHGDFLSFRRPRG